MKLTKIHGKRWGAILAILLSQQHRVQARLGVEIHYVTNVNMHVNTEVMADNFRKFVKMLNIRK